MLCRPTNESQELVAQASEVDGVKWMPIEEYHSNPFSASKPLYSKLVDQCIAYANGKYAGLQATNLASGIGNRVELLMHGAEDAKL